MSMRSVGYGDKTNQSVNLGKTITQIRPVNENVTTQLVQDATHSDMQLGVITYVDENCIP